MISIAAFNELARLSVDAGQFSQLYTLEIVWYKIVQESASLIHAHKLDWLRGSKALGS